MVIAAICIIVALVVAFFFQKGAAKNEVHAKFGLSPASHSIVSTDLGDSSPRKRLYGRGIAGEPDALFLAAGKKHMVVGEYKSRKYRGYVRPYELYQCILYQGLALQQHQPRSVAGVLAYADHRVDVAFDADLFAALVDLRPEMLSSFKKKAPVNPTPLHKRMNVLACNRHIRLGHRDRS